MKAGQKSVTNGIENYLCPFTKMYISQGAGGSYSHAGTMANDVTNGNGAKAPYYAGCTLKLVWRDVSNGQGWWKNTKTVRLADGTICKPNELNIMTAHDETFDATIGLVVPQGNQLGNMGRQSSAAIQATGVHCHIEHGIGANAKWIKNKYGIYCFDNEKDTDSCYFCDNTQILNMHTANWKYLKDAPNQSTPEQSNQKKPDQILTVGSVVTSVAMKIGDPTGKNAAIKTLNGDECVYIPALGGYYPTRLVSEYDASDGAKDNYLANTNARVYVDESTVTDLDIPGNRCQINGIWVNSQPLIEIQNGL